MMKLYVLKDRTLLSRFYSGKAGLDAQHYCITGICGAALRLGPGVAF